MSHESMAHGSCVGGEGPNVHRFPGLVFAPDQWGPGVRCQSNGTSVAKICDLVKADGGAPTLDQIAARFDISKEEAADAIRYVHEGEPC